jgi:copper transport protein
MSVTRRVAASAALVVSVVVAGASPAAAHAILLRTDPSPQTTVKQSPTAVALFFSEPVEVAFGAIRVFDVDGHRVDRSSIRRAQGNREVLVPVPHLKDGTYTVTWRVVSADGHPVHGGFTFYVGAPSSISAVAVAGDQGAGRVVGWSYGVVRFAWFAALLGLIGAVVVRRWVWTPALRAAGLSGSEAGAHFRRRFGQALPALWVLLVVAGGLTIVYEAASVSGLSFFSAFRPSVVSEALGTTFGRLWKVEMLVSLAALVPVVALARRRPLLGARPSLWIAILGVALAGLCAVAAVNGHARTLSHPAIEVPSVAVHLLAVGVWVGGLAAVVLLGGLAWRTLPGTERPALLRQLVPRFSRVAVLAVAAVVVTGVINAFGDLSTVSDLWRTTYGRVVSAKIVLLLLALALAARHLWVVPRRLSEPSKASPTTRSFARTSAAELVLLLGAVGLAAALVALVPGRSLALAAKGPVNQERAAGGYTVQLFIDPTTVGANQVHVTFVNAQGLAAAEVSRATVTLGRPGEPAPPVDMRLISPGHFVGDTTLPSPGRYRLTVKSNVSTTFSFNLRKGKQ